MRSRPKSKFTASPTLEFVKDRATKEPFSPEREVGKLDALEALDRGLVTYPGSGTVDGVMDDHLKLTPPLIITRPQVDELADILDRAIAAVGPRL